MLFFTKPEQKGKETRVCVNLRWSGRLFHRCGAAEQKDQSSIVAELSAEGLEEQAG